MGSEPKTRILMTLRLVVVAGLVILIAVLMRMVGASIFDVEFKDIEQAIISNWVLMVIWLCGMAFGAFLLWRKDPKPKGRETDRQISN